MRLVLMTLFLAACLCHAEEPPASVQKAFRVRDASLDWYKVIATKPLDADTSVMLAYASPTEPGRGPGGRLPVFDRDQAGLFVLSRKTNLVRMVVDVFAFAEVDGFPALEQPDHHSIRIHFYSDYGIYNGSRKYFYDLEARKPPVMIRYGILGMTSCAKKNGALIYSASYGQWTGNKLEQRFANVTIVPAPDSVTLPGYKVANVPESTNPAVRPNSFHVAGQTLVVENQTPPGQLHVASRVRVVGSNGEQSYPVPIPTTELNRKMVPEKPRPLEIENDIGPFAFGGRQIWFANSFPDGEGYSSVGAIGTFDASTHKFEMRYLPEIAPWSGSAILLDGDDIWVGLSRRPEGAEYGVGLLRYNKVTGAVTKYAVADLIHTIDRIGDTIYCGTSNGLYIVRGDQVRQFRFEPDETGKLAMAAAPVAANGIPASRK
jgi:hypothetical protein